MKAKPFFLFQCGASEYYALSDRRWCQRQLPANIGEGTWKFRRRLCPADLGATYFEAATLLADRPFRILRLQLDEHQSVLECWSPHVKHS